MKFTEANYLNPQKSITKFLDHSVNIAVTLTDSGVVANADGKKIVVAGTILGTAGANPILTDEAMLAIKSNTQGVDGVKAEGVLFNDVDVTHGPNSGAMMIHGFVDLDKLPEAPCAEAKTALAGRITFIK